MQSGVSRRHRYLVLVVALCVWSVVAAAQAPTKVTSPKDAFGFSIGDDYQMASYTQLEAHWKKLAAESDRVKLVDMGPTEEGRHQWMAIISSSDNLKRLDRHKEISARLAHAEGQQYLDGGTAMVDASLGAGKVLLLGPEVAFRGQPHATFKLLFNALLYSGAKPVSLSERSTQ